MVQPLKQPKQARSQKTAENIISASKLLLQQKSFADLTIGEIVRNSKSSTGSFYARFGDKQALLHSLHERFVDEAKQNVEDFAGQHAGQKLSLQELADSFVPALIDLHTANSGILRAALIESLNDERFAQRTQLLILHSSELLAGLVKMQGIAKKRLKAELVAAILAVIAVMDQELFLGVQARKAKKSKFETDRLRRIFLASFSIGR